MTAVSVDPGCLIEVYKVMSLQSPTDDGSVSRLSSCRLYLVIVKNRSVRTFRVVVCGNKEQECPGLQGRSSTTIPGQHKVTETTKLPGTSGAVSRNSE